MVKQKMFSMPQVHDRAETENIRVPSRSVLQRDFWTRPFTMFICGMRPTRYLDQQWKSESNNKSFHVTCPIYPNRPLRYLFVQ